MYIKIGFWLVWLCFITYAFLLAPPQEPNTFELIKNLSVGNWQGINPLIIALFNLMGILPIIYTCFLLIDGKEQKVRAWGFALASFGVGAFAILPYLALRQPQTEFTGEKDWFLKIIDSRLTGLIVTLAALIVLVLGLTKGDWSDFIQQWQSSRFINVMSLDFCLLSILLPVLIKDDLAKRKIENSSSLWLASTIPFFGALIYLCLRPPLKNQVMGNGE
jgi:hypothetical protein